MDDGNEATLPDDATEPASLALVRQAQAEYPYGTVAFQKLVERYANRVYRRAVRLVGSRQDAEEVTQDVFLRAFRSIQGYRPERPFEHWLLTITTNCARNLLRTRYREADKRSAYGDFVRRWKNQYGPEHTVYASELERAIRTLDPTTQTAILLRFLEGCSYPEISKELGIGQSAAKMRVRRGIGRLRKILTEGD